MNKNNRMISVAALADIHCSEDSVNMFKPVFQKIANEADLLLIAGDLTRYGKIEEARTLLDELSVIKSKIPVIGVLGNHDYHSSKQKELTEVFRHNGVNILNGQTVTLCVKGMTVGIAGTKGFGGGFGVRALPEFGEDILKLFYKVTMEEVGNLENGLKNLEADIKIVLLHYSPITDTLLGEPHEIYAFMGSSGLAAAIDKYGANIVLHGHAHFGTEEGKTPGGVPVRNVSTPMLGRPYAVYGIETNGEVVTVK